MTTLEAFEVFKSELELPDAKQKEASDAHQDVRAKVAKYLYVSNSFLTGSYARHTKIHPLSDIDVFLVRNDVPTTVSAGGTFFPATALNELYNAVKTAYPLAKITTQSRSVNLEIPGLPFGFDLIPAWQRSPDGFLIPDADTGSWVPTHPDWHANHMTAANDAAGRMLKPVIKMAKHWSRKNLDLLRSFHIELICKDILRAKPASWSVGMASVLVSLPDYIGKQMMDPAYMVTRVDKPLTSTDLSSALSRARYDAGNAATAIQLEQAGRHGEAIEKWKHVFVSGFPS